MVLARMIATDEDAMICDLAETYHVFDYRALPVKLLAVLCSGLRSDSRVRQAMEQISGSQTEILLGRQTGEEENSGLIQTFDSPEEFMAAMEAAKGGGNGN